MLWLHPWCASAEAATESNAGAGAVVSARVAAAAVFAARAGAAASAAAAVGAGVAASVSSSAGAAAFPASAGVAAAAAGVAGAGPFCRPYEMMESMHWSCAVVLLFVRVSCECNILLVFASTTSSHFRGTCVILYLCYFFNLNARNANI